MGITKKLNKYVMGRKLGMTQLIKESGVVDNVTLIQIEKGEVVAAPDQENNENKKQGITCGFQQVDEKKCNKPHLGIFKKLETKPFKYLKTLYIENKNQKGEALDVNQFEMDEVVSVRGKTIGKGFAGTIARHNFACGPKSHGSKNKRAPGSIGGGTYPGKVWKGKKMPGQYGNVIRTVSNLRVAFIDVENNVLGVVGSVPGKKTNLIEVFN